MGARNIAGFVSRLTKLDFMRRQGNWLTCDISQSCAYNETVPWLKGREGGERDREKKEEKLEAKAFDFKISANFS